MPREAAFHRMNWPVLIVGPIVLCCVLMGIWLTMTAAIENVRFAKETDRLLNIVSLSRTLGIDSRYSPQMATDALFSRLGHPVDGLYYDSSRHMVSNTWGKVLAIKIFPQDQTLVLRDTLSATACRRLVLLFSKDSKSIGLMNVESSDNPQSGAWRQLFDLRTQKGQIKLDISAVNALCGASDDIVLSLTFAMK